MSTYYAVACDELKERIDPGSIDDLGMKAGAIAHLEHPFGSVVIFALRTRWRGKSCRFVDDGGSDPGYFDYEDITESILFQYNAGYRTSLRFTP